MSSRFGEDDFYAPLPPKLPPKRRESDPIDHVVDDRPHRPVKVHNYHHDHRNPHEEDDWPQVESSRSPRRERNGERERDRDRGPQYVLVNGDGHRHRHRHHGHEREYERVRVVRPEPVLVDVTDDLVRRAARAEDELHRAQLALERERRYREREERDRERERERDLREIGRIRDHEHRVVVPRTILREPRGRVAIREHGGDVVVVQHRTPVVARPVEHVESLALDRARAEYRHTQRREGVHEEERSRGTAGRRVIVVDGDDLYGGRGRGGGRDTRY